MSVPCAARRRCGGRLVCPFSSGFRPPGRQAAGCLLRPGFPASLARADAEPNWGLSALHPADYTAGREHPDAVAVILVLVLVLFVLQFGVCLVMLARLVPGIFQTDGGWATRPSH